MCWHQMLKSVCGLKVLMHKSNICEKQQHVSLPKICEKQYVCHYRWLYILTNHAVSNRADLRERTKTMSRHGDRRGQIADFRESFETINWLYLLFKCGIKKKKKFEWLLWHWSSLSQLNLEPTQPNGLMGCKVPTDLVKISVKEAMHMGFHYILIFMQFVKLVSKCMQIDVTSNFVKVINCQSLHVC